MRGPRRLVCKLLAIVPRSSTVHLFKRFPCPLHLTGAHSSVRMPRRGGVGRCGARQTDTQTDRHANSKHWFTTSEGAGKRCSECDRHADRQTPTQSEIFGGAGIAQRLEPSAKESFGDVL